MANILYVTEYADAYHGGSTDQASFVTEPANADQAIDFTAGATASSAFKNNTRLVRITSNAICSVLFGTNPTATVNNSRMAAGTERIIGVPMGAGFKVSAITNT